MSSPNDGLLELVGHDELKGSLHPHLGVGSFRSMAGNPDVVPYPSLLPVGLQLLGRRLELDTKCVQR